MIDVAIRPAREGDARGIATVHVESWRQAYKGLVDQAVLDGLDITEREKIWAPRLADTRRGPVSSDPSGVILSTFVAEEAGNIVGWASVGRGRDAGLVGRGRDAGLEEMGELAAIYVHPDAWGRSIGHQLLVRAQQEIVAGGFGRAYLWVMEGNERAIGFYARNGWAFDGITKRSDAGTATNVPGLRMSRDLP